MESTIKFIYIVYFLLQPAQEIAWSVRMSLAAWCVPPARMDTPSTPPLLVQVSGPVVPMMQGIYTAEYIYICNLTVNEGFTAASFAITIIALL